MSNAKPVHELAAHDLTDHPIWEWVVYQAACTVTVASGKSYLGFLEICNSALHFEAPVVVGNSGEEYWSLDSEPFEHERGKFEKYFGATYAQLLPLRWQLSVPVSGNPGLQSGVFEG